MRKLYPILSGIFLVLLFTSCKQFTTNIDDYLTYWSSESYVNAHAVRTVHYNDKDNTLSVPSAKDVTVILTVHNPKNFSLAMPTSSADAGKIIRFPALSPQPVHGTDYILTQTANDKLNLTYKSSFLQAHEWGTRDIGAEITLSSKDGRTFKQNYSFKIRANTPPKLSYVTIGKTKAPDSSGKYYYVIILKAANMTKTVGTPAELLHKDIKTLLITGKDPADIAFTTAGFTTNGRLLASAEVAQLEQADLIGSAVLPNWDTALVNDPWALRYKTDTEVKTAEQIYKFKLGDEKGLVSNEISVSTAKTQVQDVRLFYNSNDISAHAGNLSTPYSINVEEGDTSVTVTAKTEIAGAKITGEVEKWDGSTWISVSDINSGAQNEVSIPLPTPTGSVQDILYKISVEAGGDGFAAGTVNTFYVNVTKSITVTIDGSAANAWKTLRNTVRDLRAGSTIIIKGEIKATNDAGNFGEIVINKDLTIKGSDKDTDILNADKNTGSKQEHRIFKVKSGATLTLSGLTLKGGICAVGEHNGGGIYAEGALTMTDCIVTDNETGYGNGGGIYAGGNLTMTRCTVSSNTVSDNSGVGGGIYIYQTGTYAMTDCIIDHNTAKYGEGGGIYAQGNLTMIGCTVSENTAEKNNGGGIYAAKDLTMTGGTVTGNQAQSNGNGGGIYTKGKLDMTDVTLTVNKTASGDGGGIYLENGALNMTNVTLTDNEATGNKIGGGVYVNDGTFTMKGSSCITPSTGTDKNDVYLATDSLSNVKMIIVDGELNPAGGIAARITVPPLQYTEGTKVLDGSAVGTEYGKFTVTPEDTTPPQEWEVDSNGCLKKKGSGTSGTTINGSDSKAWEKLKKAVRDANNGATITINGTITATKSSGNFGEIAIDKDLTIKGQNTNRTDTLDANCNHTGSAPSNAPTTKHRIFDVQGGKTLKLENLTLKNGMNNGGLGGCILVSSGEVKLTECTIENCKAGDGGAIGAKGKATLTNTHIKKCEATSGGGAICARGSRVTMENCTLTGNKAKNGGAVCAEKDTSQNKTANVTISGGTIGGTDALDANKASKSGTDGGSGGGIWINNGTLILKDNAEVIGNTAQKNGGGIALDKGGTLTLSSGKISGNTAQKYGGGICIGTDANTNDNTGTVTMSGGEVSNNTVSERSGGGVAVLHGTFTMSNGKVSGNTAEEGGGGIYGMNFNSAKGEITVSGGEISGNTANIAGTLAGGGIKSGYKLTVSGGTIKTNKTTKPSGWGGGISVSGGEFTFLGGTVVGNTCPGGGDVRGTGIHVWNCSVKMSGSAKVDTNNDIYLSDNTKITVIAPLTGTDPVARITPETYNTSTKVLDGTPALLNSEHGKFTVTPKTEGGTTQNWEVDNNGKLKPR